MDVRRYARFRLRHRWHSSRGPARLAWYSSVLTGDTFEWVLSTDSQLSAHSTLAHPGRADEWRVIRRWTDPGSTSMN